MAARCRVGHHGDGGWLMALVEIPQVCSPKFPTLGPWLL